MRRAIFLIIAMLLLISPQNFLSQENRQVSHETAYVSARASSFEESGRFGPRIDELLIKMPADFELLETDEIDIADWPLPKELVDRWSKPPYNETIALAKYAQTAMYQLDINNNETIPTYSGWRSPTSYPQFRQAIAHLVNRTRIITEVLNGSGMPLTTPIFPWLEKWFNPNADAYPYNPIEAANILDEAGFVQGSTPNPYYDPSKLGSAQFIRVYPPGHEKAGQDLDPLIFYVRYDDSERNSTGYIIRDELLSLGIPLEIPQIEIQEMMQKVMCYGDYHLYTGGWSLDIEPTYLYGLYHSEQYWKPGYCYNYNNVHDDELDYWLQKLLFATNQDEAVVACREAQRRLAEIVGVIPLWAPLKVKAYRNDLSGVVNEESFGVDSWWTLVNAHPKDVKIGGTIRYGVSHEIESLNPVCSSGWYQDWVVLDKIYDTLIIRDPYNVTEAVPWMAKSVEVQTWNGNNTKLVFELNDNIYWHDGVKLTSEDVNFTIEYIKSFWDALMWGHSLPDFYYNVASVDHVETPDPYTVIVYMNSPGIWSLYDVGEVPILPRHIWENITEPWGFQPDPQLVGSGPFKFSEYVNGSHVLLIANREYFKFFTPRVQLKPKMLQIARETEELACVSETCMFETPSFFNSDDVNVTLIIQDNQIVLRPRYVSIGDQNNNGVPDFTIYFNSHEIIGYVIFNLSENARNYKFFHGFAFPMNLTVSGKIGNITFEKSDKITVTSSVPAIPR